MPPTAGSNAPPLPPAPARTPAPGSDARAWSAFYGRGRRRTMGLVLVLLPWAWFLVRDSWAPLNTASVAMPAIAVVAGIALLLGAAVSRRLLPLLAALSLAAMTAVTVIQPMLPQTAKPIAAPLAIASANIYENNRSQRAAATALAATGADILVAVEVPDGFPPLLAAAAGSSHPYEATGRGLLIRSAYPVAVVTVPSRLSPNRVLVARVSPPGQPAFTIFAVHAINPIQESSFAFQQDFIERLNRSALEQQAAGGAVVIAGDLNLSDRTHGYRILSSLFHDAMRAGTWAGDTYMQGIWRFAFLRIDHLFTSRTWCAANPSRFVIPGSDHEGISATIGPCG